MQCFMDYLVLYAIIPEKVEMMLLKCKQILDRNYFNGHYSVIERRMMMLVM